MSVSVKLSICSPPGPLVILSGRRLSGCQAEAFNRRQQRTAAGNYTIGVARPWVTSDLYRARSKHYMQVKSNWKHIAVRMQRKLIPSVNCTAVGTCSTTKKCRRSVAARTRSVAAHGGKMVRKICPSEAEEQKQQIGFIGERLRLAPLRVVFSWDESFKRCSPDKSKNKTSRAGWSDGI